MSIEGKRVLVCGGAGFIGEAVTHALVKEGAIVSASVYTDDPNVYADAVRYPEADLLARNSCVELLRREQPEIVFMCAGVTGGSGKFEQDPLAFVHDNLIMHANIFKACKEHGVKRVVGFSSTTGYPASALPMREDQYFDGELFTAYFNPGHTRRYIERMSAMYADHFDTVWLRVSNAYGPGDNFDPVTSHVIAATVRKVAERQDPITVWGDGSNRRDAVYISDVARGAVMAAGWPTGPFNLAAGEAMSVLEILNTLTAAAGYSPAVLLDTSKPEQLPVRLLDTAKANSLGWRPTVSMADGMVKTLEWYGKYRA